MACGYRYLAFLFSVIGARTGWADVLQHHNNRNRDGLYVDPLFARAAARNIHRDSSFHAPLPGPMWAQPLYVSNGPSGVSALIAATDGNNVLALDSATGETLWEVNLGTPVPIGALNCGDIDPVGISPSSTSSLRSRWTTAQRYRAGRSRSVHLFATVDTHSIPARRISAAGSR